MTVIDAAPALAGKAAVWLPLPDDAIRKASEILA